jgi:hypothetical protein
MKRGLSALLVVSMFGMTMMPGCATMEGSAGAGAALGSLAGGIIGHQSGRGIEGALIGALAGAIAGAIVHDVRDRQTRSAQQTYEVYNYQPSQGLNMNIEGTRVNPTRVPAGEAIEGGVDYAVMGAGNGVTVREQFVLMRDDQVLREMYAGDATRTDGTFNKTVKIDFPESIPPGTYRLANTVSTGNVTRTNYTDFEVLPKTAQLEPNTPHSGIQLALTTQR